MAEGIKVINFFTMANVDGFGGNIYVYIHTEGILVRAVGFLGSLNEFCEKSLKEKSEKHASVVRAAAEAMAAIVQKNGETGGWDEEETE